MSAKGRVREILTCLMGSFGMYQSPEGALYLYGRVIVAEDHFFGCTEFYVMLHFTLDDYIMSFTLCFILVPGVFSEE